MKSFLPMLSIIAVYLVADIFLDGPAAAAAVMAAGLLEVALIRLARRRTEIAPVLEAAALAGLVLLAWLLDRSGYSGSAWPLLELVLGLVLVVSSMAGRPWILSMAERAGFPLPGGAAMNRASLVLGCMLLLHGTFLTVTVLVEGSPPVALGAVTLVILYGAALVLLGRGAAGRRMPSLQSSGDGGQVLLSSEGTELCRLELMMGRVARARVSYIPEEVDARSVLRDLETMLRSRGARALSIEDWPLDDMELRMDGYHDTGSGFRKPL